MADSFLVDFSTFLAEADQEARAPLVWRRLLPMLGKWYADGADFAAALWLADDDEGEHYTLWQAYNSRDEDRTSQPYSLSVVAPGGSKQAIAEALEAAIPSWVAPGFEPARARTVTIPLQYKVRRISGETGPAQTLGAVSLFGGFADHRDKNTELEAAASIAASWLRLNREARITRALGDLQLRCNKVTSSRALAAQVGQVLQDHASAHIKWAVVVPDGEALNAVAAWPGERPEDAEWLKPDSVFHRFHFDSAPESPDRLILRFDAAGAPVKGTGVAHAGDAAVSVAGLEPAGEMVAVLMQRIRDAMPGRGSRRAPVIATFLLVSGPRPDFVGGLFSRTNLRILDHVGDQFRTSYSALREREMMQRVNTCIIDLPIPDMMNEEDDLEHLRRFAQLAREVLPSVTHATIVEATTHQHGTTVYYRCDAASTVRPSWLSQDVPAEKVVRSPSARHMFLFRKPIEIKRWTSKRYDLVMELSSEALSSIEETLIERIAAEIAATMDVHLDHEKWAVQLAEVRHNLRSVVMSVLGKTARIADGYEAVRNVEPDLAYDRLFRRAAFHKAIRQLRYAGEELRALTENIRTITAGKRKILLQISSIDLHEMVSECMTLFQEEMDRRALTYTLQNQLPYSLRKADGDRAWLSILFFNLVENAVKYSRQHGRIELRLWAQGPFWRFSVANFGKHIPAVDRDRIFQPYIRLDPEPGEQAMPGTGFGLASVKRIAELHQIAGLPPPGGRPVLVESRPTGLGGQLRDARTVFTVTMPRKLSGATLHAE